MLKDGSEMPDVATSRFVDAMNKKFPVVEPWDSAFTFTEGRKYDRVVHGSSVFAFVDRTTNELVKPETWNKPAKNLQGQTAGKYFLVEEGFDVAVHNADRYGSFLYKDYVVAPVPDLSIL